MPIKRLHKSRALIAQTWESQLNLSFFLGLLVVTVFLLPALGFEGQHSRISTDLVFSTVLVSGVAIAWGQPRLFVFGSFLAAIALSIRWAGLWISGANFEMWRDVATLASIALICYVLLSQVFRAGTINRARIQGAIAVYLLLGLGWAQAYQITDYFMPGSFQFPASSKSMLGGWYYLSFTTLTTLGYGDFVPIKAQARSLAMGEALVGQLYLAVLIARLIALEVTAFQSDSEAKSGE
jgi:hypothetical protein